MVTRPNIAYLFVFAALSLSGCRDDASSAAPALPDDPRMVRISEEFAGRLVIAPVGRMETGDLLRIPARIEVDAHRTARIGAAVTGRVTRIEVSNGQRVKKGTVLATLNSTELANIQLAYLKMIAQENLQKRAVERARHLFSADVISAAELQKRETEFSQAQTESLAMRNQLKILGMSKHDIQDLLRRGEVHTLSSVISTIDGTVIERNVSPGQVVQPSDALFTVSDLQQVSLVAEVPEQQIMQVRQDGRVLAEIPALGGKPIDGKLTYIADTVNPETRSVTVKMTIGNREHQLKPGMLATMVVQGESKPRLALPESAIVRENNENFVFRRIAKLEFKLVPVKVAPASGGYVVILGGIADGEVVVTGGAFHLNNERKRKELES